MKKLIIIAILVTLGIMPRMSYSARFMWCWSNASITNNVGTARTDLFNFCAAPLGDTTKAITTIYYYAEGQMPGNNANLRSFLTDAHSHGLTVEYLDGDSNWVVSDPQRVVGETFLDKVITFNQGGTATQRFDGIHYDVEPISATNWSSNETTFWSRFTTLLSNCQAKVSTYNVSFSPKIPFVVDISRNMDIDGDPITSNTQVQDIVDGVVVMNYVDHFSAITVDASGELNYGNSIGKKVIIGFDTENVSPLSSSFYDEGNQVMESRLATATPFFSTYSSFQGIALHHYDSYRNLFNPSTTRPIAGFQATPTGGSGPLSVNFADTSANNPTSWNWDFGDTGTSSLQNPTHQYGAVVVPTCYSVRLIAGNSYGSSTVTQSNYICVATTGIPQFNGGIIWDFDTHSPATITHSGYLYVYGYVNTKGIGGSNALQLDMPYKSAGLRHGGVGLWLSNYPGFSLNPVSPYNGPINNTANNLDLSVQSTVYFSILASDTNIFGVSFTVYDTTGSFFVPAGKIYVADSTQLQGSISTTAFKKVTWNLGTMHVYTVGSSTGRKPALANIEAMELFFPTNKTLPSGQAGLKFYIDNIGAGSLNDIPTELWRKY